MRLSVCGFGVHARACVCALQLISSEEWQRGLSYKGKSLSRDQLQGTVASGAASAASSRRGSVRSTASRRSSFDESWSSGDEGVGASSPSVVASPAASTRDLSSADSAAYQAARGPSFSQEQRHRAEVSEALARGAW